MPGGLFELQTTRAVSLPKGQKKNSDLVLFAPTPPRDRTNDQFATTPKRIYFSSRLLPRGGGRQLDWKSELAVNMHPSENHFVVLAERADNYQFLKNMPMTNPAREDYLGTRVDYHVKLPKGTQRVDLSPHPLTWSTVAYVLWDDFDPDILTLGQQQAMLDWLHWGGQLIVNGPKTLDRISASFLAPYLPARSGKTTKVADEHLATLNRFWAFKPNKRISLTMPQEVSDSESESAGSASSDSKKKTNRSPMKFDLQVTDDSQRPLCIELKLIGDGKFVAHSADLIAESYVGRGSIRVSAFNLPHPLFRRWVSYDSFL